jgi:KTSC domain
MTMKPVTSGLIKAIGYDPATKTLRVQFKKGAAHDYSDVPAKTHADLSAAESTGAHFNKHIRNTYPSKKVV